MGCVNELDGEILSQCIWISNHHTVHFKYLTILFVNYTSIKLGEKKTLVLKDICKHAVQRFPNPPKIYDIN